jgi:predicted MFS family arabinose efflux permease
MSILIQSRRGVVALMVAHCAGMVDLIALPVWVGALVAHYHFDPVQAGGLATAFLLAVGAASLLLAPRLPKLDGRTVTVAGFALASACFALASALADYVALMALHAGAGAGTGLALSVTHGTIARSERPHRMFALVGMALGVFAIAFIAVTPQLIAAMGGPALFGTFAAVMGFAAVVCAIAFPSASPRVTTDAAPKVPARTLPVVWFGIAGIAAMVLVQSMTFSFLERVGIDRGFGREAINLILIAVGIVNLFPAVLAAFFEKRLSARSVLLIGPVVQALLAATVMNSPALAGYAAATAVFAAVMIFTHTFAFGLLARLEPTGRALATTPAMLMLGSAVGPLLGGVLVTSFGYGSLGLAAVVVAAAAVFCFSRLPADRPAVGQAVSA